MSKPVSAGALSVGPAQYFLEVSLWESPPHIREEMLCVLSFVSESTHRVLHPSLLYDVRHSTCMLPNMPETWITLWVCKYLLWVSPCPVIQTSIPPFKSKNAAVGVPTLPTVLQIPPQTLTTRPLHLLPSLFCLFLAPPPSCSSQPQQISLSPRSRLSVWGPCACISQIAPLCCGGCRLSMAHAAVQNTQLGHPNVP